MANKVGTMVGYNIGVDLVDKLNKCKEIGITSCQINIWNTSIFTSDEHAKIVKDAIAETGMTVSSLWAGAVLASGTSPRVPTRSVSFP